MANAKTLENIQKRYHDILCETLTNKIPLDHWFKTTDCIPLVRRAIPELANKNDQYLREIISKHLQQYDDISRVGNRYCWKSKEVES